MINLDQISNLSDSGKISEDAIHWNPESGYAEGTNFTINASPRPIAGSGQHMGLTLKLNADLKNYYCSSTSSAGFKILLHSPVEMPKIKDYGFSIEPGFETHASIAPQLNDASNLIRRVPIEIRQCIFEGENTLKFFKSYSKKNCEMECEADLVDEACGCVMHFMPRATEDTVICERSEYACYEKIKLKIDSSKEDYLCECLPGCSEINYKISLSSAKIGNGSFAISDHELGKMDSNFVHENIALIHLFLMHSSFRSFTKEELMGFTDFLSNTGGLLGLFMGFSVISLIEIMYFLTCYPFFRQKLKNRNEKKKKMEQRLLVSQNSDDKFKLNSMKRGKVKLYTSRW